MKRVMQVVAIVAVLGAVPALAEEGAPVPGSDRDPFSQTYSGPSRDATPAPAKDSKPCAESCPCARHAAAAAAAESPRFTDGG